MSYASAVKDHGPKQSHDDKLADPVPEIKYSKSSSGTVDTMSSDTVNIPSYAEQEKEAEELKRDVAKSADKASKDAKDFGQKASADAKRLESEAGKQADELSKDASKKASQLSKEVSDEVDKASKVAGQTLDKYAKEFSQKTEELSKEASNDYDKAKASAARSYESAKKELREDGKKVEQIGRDAEDWAEKNKGNPVVIGNAVVMGVVAAALGAGAYRMNQAGTLTWKVAGTWAGIVGVFAVSDYYLSQWLFRNKYPPKK
ncbi:hypothetical protein K470DRAFT_257927 [Piedraia hortae CBS 480.64]|uniref:Uncharacterized protein n=1 Tax=Piedraia hortae CBS 480.64 TaxID=1314780 RepID=A0A6A7BZS8_9PEZI|nr:hypothetical protein K470DRAFT_257927 [Piedraia hortae CBS 480.64]